MDEAVINIHGYEVLISACDLERVLSFKWHKMGRNSKSEHIYFSHKTPRPEHKDILLHRFITGCPDGKIVDHKNGNTLDNRRSNLRICTKTENNRNRRKNKNNTSGYKGVFWDDYHKKWSVSIKNKGRRVYLGLFDDPQKAYEAYVAASQKYHGEFGCVG
jgi:hypothetical protein